MASNVRTYEDTATPAVTLPEKEQSRPDRVTMMRQADNKLQQAEMKLQQAEMLLDVSRRVAAIESLDEILKILVETIALEVNAERASLFLNDVSTDELYTRVAQGEISREIRILNTAGVAGSVFQSGEATIIPDAYKDERFNSKIDEQTGFKTTSIVCAPVKTVRGEVIGVTQALNKKDGTFTQDDLDLLETITTQAAVALQSSQFVDRMKKTR